MTPSERRERLVEWLDGKLCYASDIIELSGLYPVAGTGLVLRDLRRLEGEGRVRRERGPHAYLWEIVR